MNDKGFTLIEMSILIIIVGMLSIPLFKMYDTYQYDKKVRITRENIQKIKGELAIYAIKNNRYPRPADAGLRKTHPNFGQEVDQTLANGVTMGGCGGLGGGICRYNGARDTDTPTDGPDPILVGSVPVVTLMDLGSVDARMISSKDTLDGWGNRIMYAVTAAQATDNVRYDEFKGAIAIVTPLEDGTLEPVGGIENDAHYALISHGKDGLGAYSENGERLTLCASGLYGDPADPNTTNPAGPGNPIGTAASLDVLNCDANGLFVLGLDYSEAKGPRHYDDMIGFGKSARSSLWGNTIEPNPADPNGPMILTDNIQNLNTGLVGFGKAPTEQLDIDGAIRAESRIRSEQICDSTNRCFNLSVLTGDPDLPASVANDATATANNEHSAAGIRCASGRAMTGISQSQEQCATPALPTTWTAKTCPTVSGRKTWLKGVRSDGTIECSN